MWRSSALVVATALALGLAGAATPADGPTWPRSRPVDHDRDQRPHAERRAARTRPGGEVGGVILFARNIGTTAEVAQLIDTLQAAAAAGGNPPLLIAVDQEGGVVKRLPAGPPDRSAAAMGRERSVAVARSQGKATAAYLKELGIGVDLAPVLDTPDPARPGSAAARSAGIAG